ncbi:MAG: 50S ribosomal protein L11 methyltransferase [Polyangiaceae bacterium]
MTEPASEPRYPYVLVDVDPELGDAMASALFDLGAKGVEERDQTTLVKGTPGKLTLVASFASHEEALAAIDSIDDELSPRLEEVVGDAWRDEWKKYFKPFEIVPGIVIRPPWEAWEGSPTARVIELEPGRAFGTGLHETTSLVTRVLHAHKSFVEGKRVLDVGSGSGILGLLAVAVGAHGVRGVEIDEDAVRVSNENAERNGMKNSVFFDSTDVGDLDETFPVVVANIEAKVLVPLSETIRSKVAPGGLLVLSGILVPQKDDVVRAYDAFELLEAPEKGEWIALVLRAPG